MRASVQNDIGFKGIESYIGINPLFCPTFSENVDHTHFQVELEHEWKARVSKICIINIKLFPFEYNYRLQYLPEKNYTCTVQVFTSTFLTMQGRRHTTLWKGGWISGD